MTKPLNCVIMLLSLNLLELKCNTDFICVDSKMILFVHFHLMNQIILNYFFIKYQKVVWVGGGSCLQMNNQKIFSLK